MVTINEALDIARNLKADIDRDTVLKKIIDEFNGNSGPYEANPQGYVHKFATTLEQIRERLYFLRLLDDDQKAFLRFYGFEKLLMPDLYDTAIQSVQTDPKGSFKKTQSVIQRITSLADLLANFIVLNSPLGVGIALEHQLKEDESIIEIVFNGNVAIDDFVSANKQIEDWYLIIDGYAHLLDVQKEDFEIISIIKSSPAKFKIKTLKKNAGVVLGIVSGLLLIQQTYLQNKILVHNIKKSELHEILGSDNMQSADKKLDSLTAERIKNLVEEKIKSLNPENTAIYPNVNKAIEKQYQFITNGGTVNVVIDNPSSEQQKLIDSLAEMKRKILELEATANNIGLLAPPKDQNDITDSSKSFD